jgi:hypothetical protein
MKPVTVGHICAEADAGRLRLVVSGRRGRVDGVCRSDDRIACAGDVVQRGTLNLPVRHRGPFVRQDAILRQIASVVERLYEGDELFP